MTTNGPDGPPKRERTQMNVRLPVDLVERVDARRQRTGLSRDLTVERMLEWALAQPVKARSLTRTSRGRTADQRRTITK